MKKLPVLYSVSFKTNRANSTEICMMARGCGACNIDKMTEGDNVTLLLHFKKRANADEFKQAIVDAIGGGIKPNISDHNQGAIL